MGTRAWPSHRSARAGQSGQAVLLLLALLGIAATGFLYSMFSPSSAAAAREAATRAALAQAKEALIGRAAVDANRPGSLPCPDTNNDGSAELYAGAECPGHVSGSNVYIGRLPWRTLGLPDLRDDSGERLWYAVAREFARNPTCAPNCPINSDTPGELSVEGNSPVARVVAIVFAPGPTLSNQARTTTEDRNKPANYLEGENASSSVVFSAMQPSDTFNDRLLAITTADLMPMVEQRVARELRTVLQNYKASTASLCTNLGGTGGCYPWADLSDGSSDAPPFEAAGSGLNRGRVPTVAAAPVDWPDVPESARLPAWFHDNNWRYVIYYSAARNAMGPGSCHSCTASTLSVDGVSGKELVILTPGPVGVNRPELPDPPPALNASDYWEVYFQDPANASNSDDNYVTPASSAYARNRIFTIP
jgi:type II secretory pathway pseudopilin PulG